MEKTFDPPKRNDGESDADYAVRRDAAYAEWQKVNADAAAKDAEAKKAAEEAEANKNGLTTTQRAGGVDRVADTSQQSDIQNRQAEAAKTHEAETAAPGGTNAASVAVPLGGAVGLEHQATNDSLGVTGAIRAAEQNSATVGSEKTIRSLVPARNESDEDYNGRLEAFRKASADTMVAQSPAVGSKPRFASDTERRAAATPEQREAWANQRDPAGLRYIRDY